MMQRDEPELGADLKAGPSKRRLVRDEKEALSSPALDEALAKICYFDSKIAEMEKKYHSSFSDFKRRIDERRDVEVFEEWDDFIIWDSYESACSRWAEVYTRLK